MLLASTASSATVCTAPPRCCEGVSSGKQLKGYMQNHRTLPLPWQDAGVAHKITARLNKKVTSRPMGIALSHSPILPEIIPLIRCARPSFGNTRNHKQSLLTLRFPTPVAAATSIIDRCSIFALSSNCALRVRLPRQRPSTKGRSKRHFTAQTP